MKTKTALIIGAGPAGLTVAYELLKKTDVKPIIFESTDTIGGISQTAEYNGNRIDIGGHRFFSKSDEVMSWWNQILPVEKTELSKSFLEKYPNDLFDKDKSGGKTLSPDDLDEIMLVRNRLSRIYYGRKFYDYPVSLSKNTINNLGLPKMVKIGFSYLATKLHKVDETRLEGFYINRFGKELYNTFFRDYTEKLWGISPSEIDSSWGAQRVKGLSITKVLANAMKGAFGGKKEVDLSQKDIETSLIEAFLYPKLGPGTLWETVAKRVKEMGGEIYMNTKVVSLNSKDASLPNLLTSITTDNNETFSGDYIFSTIPVPELVRSLDKGGREIPADVEEVAKGLPFRDFITVGLLVDELEIKNETDKVTVNGMVPDNWIYIQEPDVRVCRLQVFNNWSPYLVKDKSKTWVGMEYVVSEHDDIWKLSNKDMAEFGIKELEKIGILDPKKVIDSTVIHIKKTYPAYFGTYPKFSIVKEYVDKIDNLYLIGRNGQHRYNNMDHSMLTAFRAVENIANGDEYRKDNIWEVNSEQEYHESK